MLKMMKFTECGVKEKVMKTKYELTSTVYQGWTRCLVSSNLCQAPWEAFPTSFCVSEAVTHNSDLATCM